MECKVDVVIDAAPNGVQMYLGNRSQAHGESAVLLLHHFYDNATFISTSPCREKAALDNIAPHDGMLLRSKEWKWTEEEELSGDETERENSYNYDNDERMQEEEDDTDDLCSECGLEETEISDVLESGEETDSNEFYSDSSPSRDVSPCKEALSLSWEMHEENIRLLNLHFAARNLKSERGASFRNINEPSPEALSPIVEGHVKDYSKEQPPSDALHTIAYRITEADESFLYNSQLSLGSYGEKGKRRAATMQNLHEHDSFLNLTTDHNVGKVMHEALVYLKDDQTFGSLAALNTIAIRGTEKDRLLAWGKPIHVVPSRNHTKNVLALSISIALVFIALGSVRNLQSSINHEGGVGVISMAVSFIGYMLGSIGSPTIVQIMQPKKCVVLGLIPHLIYIASNVYPTMWLLGITSLFQGVSLAIVWNAMSTYITLLSNGQSQMKDDEDYSQVSSRYFGIFGLFFQSYFIVGNLIASLVLTNDDTASSTGPGSRALYVNASRSISTGIISDNSSSGLLNATWVSQAHSPNHTYLNAHGQTVVATSPPQDYLHLCGAEFWQHYDLGDGAYHVSQKTKYLLFGIYMGCVLVSILIIVFILEPLNPKLFHRSTKRSGQFKKQLHSLLKIWTTPRFLVIVPMLMYSFMEVGFVTAEVTKAFVTCPIGMHMVGYTMMCMGICGSISSYVSGMVIARVGRKAQILFAALANVAVLAFLHYWHPSTESYVPYFVVLGLWGISDGIWVAQINSFLCVNFPENYEAAFAGLRMCQGIGVALVFGLSRSLSMMSKIYIIGVWCIVSVTMYVIQDFHQTTTEKRARAEKRMRQTSV